jgi:hypothetical protein
MTIFRCSKFPTTAKQAKKMLEGWEYSTCRGSECYSQYKFKEAILHFKNALHYAQSGLEGGYKRTVFMKYYSLASMNLAQALTAYEKQSQSERILSDAHFNMLSFMMDKNQTKIFRREAKQQAKLLLSSLKIFLIHMGKNKVAESLEDEFYRLEVSWR